MPQTCQYFILVLNHLYPMIWDVTLRLQCREVHAKNQAAALQVVHCSATLLVLILQSSHVQSMLWAVTLKIKCRQRLTAEREE